jgi:plastocyanin domain-containing protein
MTNETTAIGKIASLALLSSLISSAALSDAVNATVFSERSLAMTQPASQFQQIEQPFATKAIVTIAGIGLMGLELWWFLGNKPQAKPEPDKPAPEDK